MVALQSLEQFRQAIIGTYRPFDGVRLNLRLDADGTWPTVSNHQADIEPDRVLLSHLRSLSDVIVTGGATARAIGYRSSKWAPIVVISNDPDTLKLPLFEVQRESSTQAILATTKRNLANQVAASVLLSDQTIVEPSSLAIELNDYFTTQNFERPLLETGAMLTKTLLPVIREVCLTSTYDSEPQNLLAELGFTNLELESELDFADLVFTRWSVT